MKLSRTPVDGKLPAGGGLAVGVMEGVLDTGGVFVIVLVRLGVNVIEGVSVIVGVLVGVYVNVGGMPVPE